MKIYGMADAGTPMSFLPIDAIRPDFLHRNFHPNRLGEMMLPSPNFTADALTAWQAPAEKRRLDLLDGTP